MAFLAPFFLLALAAVAVPVVIHLVQRERKTPVVFPSLMFLRKIPYQSVRRRRVHHWALLALRAAAIALLALAFARPFFRRDTSVVLAAAGAREVVVLLDQSASMGYGDHWQRAQAAARRAIDGLGAGDRATLVLFGENAEEDVRATDDRTRLDAAVDAAKVTAGATRYGPALRLAQSLLARSTLGRREVVLISDFQRTGWERHEDVQFPEGAVFTPVSVVDGPESNVSVTSVAFARAHFAGEDRVTVTAGLINRSAAAASALPVSLDVDGHTIQTQSVTVAANGSASVVFTPFTLADANVEGTVHAGTDALPADNVFRFVLSPDKPMPVLLVQADGAAPGDAVYLTTALSVGDPAPFHVDTLPMSRVTPAALDQASVVIVDDALVPAPIGDALTRFVERGGGLFDVLGEHAGPLDREGALLPGRLAARTDAPLGEPATLGALDYSHPIFEVFKTPHSGDFSSAEFYHYRGLDPAPTDRVLARFSNGTVAMAERRVGGGRVIAFGSSLDGAWNTLAVRPVFLPLMYTLVRYLGRYEPQPAWYTAGQMFDPSQRLPALLPDPVTHAARGSAVVATPSGARLTPGADGQPLSFALSEQGFYTVRPEGTDERRPLALAVNLDPRESDLSSMDLQEFTGMATGHATATAAAGGEPTELTAAEIEKKQSLWWYVMLAAVLMLAAEALLANRLSAKKAGHL